MKLLTRDLKKYSKKGIYSFLNEAYIRFNFNGFYVDASEDETD